VAVGGGGFFEEGFEAEFGGVVGEEAAAEVGGGEGGAFAALDGLVHEGEEAGPVEWVGALELERAGFAEAGFGGSDEDVAFFVETAAASAAKHLEKFIGANLARAGGGDVFAVGDEDRLHGEVDAGGEAGGGDDDAELAGLGKRFDEGGALLVVEAAVVEGDAVLEELAEAVGGEEFLLGGKGEEVEEREGGGEFAGEFLGGAAAGGEDEEGAEVGHEGAGDEAGPEAADGGGDAVGEGFEFDFLLGDGAVGVVDEDGVAANAAEPLDGFIGVGDAAAEEEKLGGGFGEGEDEFVVHAADGVAEHLVFVHDEEVGAFGAEEAAFLGFEGGDDDGGVEVVGDVAGGDADVPAGGAPFVEFVVGEGAGGDGEDGVAAAALLHEELEDEGFAGAGGSVDDDIPPRLEMTHRLLLPEVGNLQGDFKTVTYFEVNRHWRCIVGEILGKANSS